MIILFINLSDYNTDETAILSYGLNCAISGIKRYCCDSCHNCPAERVCRDIRKLIDMTRKHK